MAQNIFGVNDVIRWIKEQSGVSGSRTVRLHTHRALSWLERTEMGFADADARVLWIAFNARTMREFDALCLERVKSMSAAQIRRLRRRNRVSQAVFAAYLNTSQRCRNGSAVRRSRTGHR